MDFEIEKCSMLRIKKRKETTEGIELQNLVKDKTLGDKEIYENLGIVEMDTIKQRWKKKSIIHYDCGPWNLTKRQERKKIDENYTVMLHSFEPIQRNSNGYIIGNNGNRQREIEGHDLYDVFMRADNRKYFVIFLNFDDEK